MRLLQIQLEIFQTLLTSNLVCSQFQAIIYRDFR